jgi:hypothetical protein
MKKRVVLLWCIVVFLPLLVSCGGGSGGKSSGATGTSNDTGYNTPPAYNQPDSSSGNTSIPTHDVTLTWAAPATNADGTPLTDLAGYRVYFGPGSGNYIYKNDVGNVTICTIGGLTQGTWCFAVTAYDTSGNESDYSNEVCVVIN